MPRAPRVAAAGMLLVLALPSLAACRTSPDVAAYVGDAEVTVAELERAVDERLADEDVAAFAAANGADYTRRVLGFLVEQEVHAAAAERYGVTVGDAAVRDRIDELMGGQDPEDVYAQLAEQGVSRTDVVDTIRRQLVREEIAESEGRGDLGEDALRELYEEVRQDYAQLEFGYITVPDEAAATAVLAELTDDPAAYAAVAARHPGDSTLPELARLPADRLPPVLRDELTAAEPNTGFVVQVEDVGTVVGFVTGTVYPSFEELREQVQAAAAARVDAAGAEVVQDVREDLDITVNPRYGVLDEAGRLVRGEGGVVEILTEPDDGAGSGPGD